MLTLRDTMFDNPAIQPDRLAIIAGDRRFKWRDLQQAVARIASRLRASGVAPGDRVAILLETVPEYIIGYFAITSIGGIYVPLNWRLHPSEHVVLMNNARPKVLIASSAFAESIAAARSEVRSVVHVVTVGEPVEGCVPFADWLQTPGTLPDDYLPSPDDGALIVYTSGTTGSPKGCLLTHGNVVTDFKNVWGYAKPHPESICVHVAPLYHQTFVHVLTHLSAGGCVVLVSKFDVCELLSTIERHKGTYIFLAPTMVYEILDFAERDRYDLSSLQTIIYGAAPITGARLRQAVEIFGRILVQGYGLSEATSHVCYLGKEEHMIAEGSIGKALPGVESRVVRPDGTDVAPGEIGEIIVRGPTVMKGYWEAPEATAATIVEGWLHSGDLAKVDERGFRYIMDRVKDLVISGGVNIYPRDIEEVVAAYTGVAECAAFGTPDPYWGEALTVAVVARPGYVLDADELTAYCRSRLGGYQVPKRIEIVAELPKNLSGKVLKRELRRMFSGDPSAVNR